MKTGEKMLKQIDFDWASPQAGHVWARMGEALPFFPVYRDEKRKQKR